MEDCEIDGKKVSLAYAKPQVTHSTPKPKAQPSVQAAELPKDQPEQKPGSQPETQPGGEKPVSKDQPGGKAKPSKRKRNKNKGNVEINLMLINLIFFQIYFTKQSYQSKLCDKPNS